MREIVPILAGILIAVCGIHAYAGELPTTPQEFQAAYTARVNAQDQEGLVTLFVADDRHRDAVAQMVQLELSVAKLARVVRETYGTPVYGGGALVPADPHVQWKAQGEHMYIDSQDNRFPPLKKVGLGFKVDL